MGHIDRWNGAQHILCVRLDTLGDVLMTTPAIRALKESQPGRRITLLTSPAGAAIARLVPEIDQIEVYDAPWMKATTPRMDSQPEYAMIEQLRAGGYDAAVICTVYSKNALPSAFLCYMADIPLRLAYSHENNYQMLTDWVPDPEPQQCVRHEVQRQLNLVATIGCRTADKRLSLHVPPEARARVDALLLAIDIDRQRPLAVIHPGATAPSRRYPAEGFAAAARQLVREHEWQVVLTGTGDEYVLAEQIRTAIGSQAWNLVNRLDLEEMAALLGHASLLVSNNTGPVHMAAALGTPVVDLYALTNPQHTPWAVPHRVLCHDVPCKYCYKSVCPEGHHRCLRLVPPEAIVQAACELIAHDQYVAKELS